MAIFSGLRATRLPLIHSLFTGHPSNKDMDQKRQTTLNRTKAHSEFLIAHSQIRGIAEQHKCISLSTCLLSTHLNFVNNLQNSTT